MAAVFQHGVQCSVLVFKRAGCHLKRAELKKKGTISTVNGRKRALLIGPVIFRFKKSNFPFQKKGNSVSIPFHYWQR